MPAKEPRSRVRVSGPVALVSELFRTHPFEPQSERRSGEELSFKAFAPDSAQKAATKLALVDVLPTIANPIDIGTTFIPAIDLRWRSAAWLRKILS